jgi:hypothetical protein
MEATGSMLYQQWIRGLTRFVESLAQNFLYFIEGSDLEQVLQLILGVDFFLLLRLFQSGLFSLVLLQIII